MNSSFLKSKIFFVMFFTGFLFSCSEDNPDDVNTEFSQENNKKAAEVDQVFEGTFNIMETAYAQEEEGSSISFFPPCATITISQQGNNFELIVDFGAGCTLPNGAFVTGIILITYGPIVNDIRMIDYTFNGYTYNDHAVSGGGQIERKLVNVNGNPQSTVNETITVAFPQSTVTANRTGIRIAEWVEGVGSGNWQDNVFHITGNWDTQLSNGFYRSGIVTDKLVKKANCPIFVDGTIALAQNGLTATLDYGDGTCDNLVTLTYNGIDYIIILQ